MKVAVVHDWLVTYAGAERVLEQILRCYPNADVFSLIDFAEERAFLQGRPVTTSFIQRLPFARKRYRGYLPLMPLAIEQLDVSGYDLVISSSHAVAKGVLTGPDQLHVSYVHTPIRYAWDLQHQYLRESDLQCGLRSVLARMLLHYIRNWDARTRDGVDHYIANSAFVARRIRKIYGRHASVIHPPVDVDAFVPGGPHEDYYVTVSRLVPYKRVPLIAEAFRAMPGRKLVIVGAGPELDKVRAAAGPNVQVLGHQPFEAMRRIMQHARAFVFAAEEDFGISVVEAQACGTPVIAYGRGGALESVRDETSAMPTGLFFAEQSVPSIVDAVERFERNAALFRPEYCRLNAEQFSADNFREALLGFVARAQAMAASGRQPDQPEGGPARAVRDDQLDRTGRQVGVMTPGPEVGRDCGWVDVPMGITALRRADGEYVVLVGEDARGKNLMYRWRPALAAEATRP